MGLVRFWLLGHRLHRILTFIVARDRLKMTPQH